MAYQPKQGDIIVIDFNPQAGHECEVLSNLFLKIDFCAEGFRPA